MDRSDVIQATLNELLQLWREEHDDSTIAIAQDCIRESGIC